MSDKQKKNLIMVIALGQLMLAVAIMIFGVVNKRMTNMQSNVLIGGSLFLYWLLMDVVDAKVRHLLDDLPQERKTAYYQFILFDLAGLAGIAIFLFGIGGTGSTMGILGAAVYAFTMKPKKENQDIFYGLKKPEEDEEADDAEETAAEADVNDAEANGVETDEANMIETEGSGDSGQP